MGKLYHTEMLPRSDTDGHCNNTCHSDYGYFYLSDFHAWRRLLIRGIAGGVLIAGAIILLMMLL
ncbi:hypothetical protein JCM19037_3011 [Geomicrobium sp. JCM 19037]|nr:hypothetical protein JCM19037_3011 [Geomicrobium sp. JCM 19037]